LLAGLINQLYTFQGRQPNLYLAIVKSSVSSNVVEEDLKANSLKDLTGMLRLKLEH
jgi:hypothetical protein